jgi:hypothetical protein
MSASIPAFTFVVDEVFAFSGGVTAFIGRVITDPAPGVLTPCDAEVIVDGKSMGMLRLVAERMSGPRYPSARTVETHNAVDAASIRGRKCLLVHRE